METALVPPTTGALISEALSPCWQRRCRNENDSDFLDPKRMYNNSRFGYLSRVWAIFTYFWAPGAANAQQLEGWNNDLPLKLRREAPEVGWHKHPHRFYNRHQNCKGPPTNNTSQCILKWPLALIELGLLRCLPTCGCLPRRSPSSWGVRGVSVEETSD